ncbi:MAG: hypothetical protein JHC95_12260 [Solirubrobacteraceae bacterium]|nr:hypothetical protein [Solirubrobacteraceae bacterium]
MTMTYPQRLDGWAAESGGSWRVYSQWHQVTGFERHLLWFGEARDRSGAVVAEVRDYKPEKVIHGEVNTARRLWKALVTNRSE